MKNVDTNMETRTRVPTYFKDKTLTSKKADKRNYHISQLVHELQYVFKRSLCKLRNTPKKKKSLPVDGAIVAQVHVVSMTEINAMK